LDNYLELITIVASVLTIVSITVSIILWFKYRERDKWVYSIFLSTLDSLDRIVQLSRTNNKKEMVARVGDMAVTLRDNMSASLLSLRSRKKIERLRSWMLGYKNMSDRNMHFLLSVGESDPHQYARIQKILQDYDGEHGDNEVVDNLLINHNNSDNDK